MRTFDAENFAGARWLTSSYSSGHGGACVEVAKLIGGAAVRDSKNRADGTLVFSADAWGAFVTATAGGSFDLS